MTSPNDLLVERMAKAISDSPPTDIAPHRDVYAALQAIADAGMAIVPVEPTKTMILNACEAWWQTPEGSPVIEHIKRAIKSSLQSYKLHAGEE